MALTLARRWWVFLVRGLAAIAFGILAFVAPGYGLWALVLAYGTYAIVDGTFNFSGALQRASQGRPWGSFVFEGIVSLAAGVAALVWPGISSLVLLVVISVWAIITGFSEVASAIRLRKHIRGEWLLALSGVLSVAFGVLLFIYPRAGALAVVFWIGAYAMIFGALLVGLSFRLRAWSRREEHQLPSSGIPTPA
jgi:uncharacterized membrane protein HdeD (DUF308 family)